MSSGILVASGNTGPDSSDSEFVLLNIDVAASGFDPNYKNIQYKK